MSRSGYVEDFFGENWSLIRWRGQVASAIRGKRGQAFLKELGEALDAMPEKKLIAHDLRKGGEVCAIGSLGAKRGVELEKIDPYDHATLSGVFNIAEPLVQEIEWENDDGGSWDETPEKRWQRMRQWVAANLKDEPK